MDPTALAKDSGDLSYMPLESKQIRLLMIHSGPKDSNIECTLSISSFPPPLDSPSYHALSYTWGNSDSVVSIKINGQQFRITPNLEAALRQFRSHTNITTWWVDALCINQSDNDEKNGQVKLMRYIYMGAEAVHIWLGTESETSTSVMQMLAANEENGFRERLMRSLWTQYKSILQSFIDFFNGPYWKRAWILQEVVCASDAYVHCGDWWVEWSTLVTVNEMLRKLEKNRWPQTDVSVEIDSPKSIHSCDVVLITSIKEQRDRAIACPSEKRPVDPTSLLSLVATQGNRQATDPRDKVFAMAGLADDINHGLFPFCIDYNLSVEEVYINLVKYTVNLSNRLDILREVRSSQKIRSKFSLPTWCPNWDLGHENNSLWDILCGYFKTVDTSGSTFIKVVFRPDNKLVVAGILQDKIRILCDVFDWNHLFWYLWLALVSDRGRLMLQGRYTELEQTSLCRWAAIIQLSNPNIIESITDDNIPASSSQIQYAVWQSILDYVPNLAFDGTVSKAIQNLWKTLIASEEFDWDGDGGFDAMLRCYIGLVEPPSYDGLSPDDALLKHTRPLRRFVTVASGRRRFFVSENGRFGLAPEDAQEGDSICVLFGCSLPMLLRPQRETFEVIGPAYFQGIMNGEAVEEMENGRVQKQEFVLQ